MEKDFTPLEVKARTSDKGKQLKLLTGFTPLEVKAKTSDKGKQLKLLTGFTLIEIVVVMVIIGILSSVLFMSRGSEEKRFSLQVSAFRLSQDLREAQEMAMGAGESKCGASETFVFGLYFDKDLNPDSYLFFADCNGNKKYQPTDNDLGLKTIFAKKDVQICDLSENKLNIVFAPPEPSTFVNGAGGFGEVFITLCLKAEPSRQIKVKVNTVGKIEVQ